MLSLRSILIREVSKAFIKKQNLGKKTLSEERESMESFTKWFKLDKTIQIEKLSIDGLSFEKISHPDAVKGNIIIHLHGGGYTVGSINTHRLLAADIAKAAKAEIFIPEYRLAPENPFPAALTDSLKIYKWILEQGINPSKIIISGDSAGGGLALATFMALKNNGDPLPVGLICISPWVDLLCSGKSHILKSKQDPVLSTEYLKKSALLYAGEEDLKNPLISPLYGDFQGFPPMLIQVGTEEILFDDAITLTEEAKSSRVDVRLSVWDGMWHVWHMVGKFLPESINAINEIGDFAQELFSNNTEEEI